MLTRQNVFGSFGPGKRSHWQYIIPVDRLSKRYPSDYGYRSRIDAGSKVANAKIVGRDIFGVTGPGKRSLHANAQDMLEYNHKNNRELPVVVSTSIPELGRILEDTLKHLLPNNNDESRGSAGSVSALRLSLRWIFNASRSGKTVSFRLSARLILYISTAKLQWEVQQSTDSSTSTTDIWLILLNLVREISSAAVWLL